MRPARAPGTSEHFWMGLQTDYDPEETRSVTQSKPKKVENIAAWFELALSTRITLPFNPSFLLRGLKLTLFACLVQTAC
jgi:hypothetical protein